MISSSTTLNMARSNETTLHGARNRTEISGRWTESGAAARGDLTQILSAASGGDRLAASQLLPLVYEELRRLARARVVRSHPGGTLTPTELVHEAYLRMTGGQGGSFENRRHFFFASSRAMRDIMVECARRKASLKRGGDYLRVDLEKVGIVLSTPPEHFLELDHALDKLKNEQPDRARVVQLRYFGGLTQSEISEVMGLSRATVKRRLGYAHAWLRRELSMGITGSRE